ncbi:hypothetical protein [Haloarcula sp. CGMCC 1.2071]|uniref:hypothetical protein n=1 Tax=Haloarcula sp. CGMCC 1.2071 TaxID=3111454 RepID=UPI00300F739E
MSPSPRLHPTLQAAGIGLFIIGIATTGFAAYSEIQSTPYMVQIDQSVPDTNEPTVPYSDLTSAEKEVFDRVNDGGAAPVEDATLSTFANNAVQYQGSVYSFEMTYDPATLTILPFGLGITVAAVGGVLFFLTPFITGRSPQTNSPFV